jgi:hypothetical protein
MVGREVNALFARRQVTIAGGEVALRVEGLSRRG